MHSHIKHVSGGKGGRRVVRTGQKGYVGAGAVALPGRARPL